MLKTLLRLVTKRNPHTHTYFSGPKVACGDMNGVSIVGHVWMNESMCVSVVIDANPNKTKKVWRP